MLPLSLYSNIVKKPSVSCKEGRDLDPFPSVKESQARGKSSLCQLSFTTIAEGVLGKAKKGHTAFLQPAAKEKCLCNIPSRTFFGNFYNQK